MVVVADRVVVGGASLLPVIGVVTSMRGAALMDDSSNQIILQGCIKHDRHTAEEKSTSKSSSGLTDLFFGRGDNV